jgi:hypothetical protein
MKRYVWPVALVLTLGVVGVTRTAAAQGVTTAAVTGHITDEGGAAVSIADVTLTNRSTGERHASRTRADGVYSFENASVGGPYVLEVRAVGFEPKTSDPFTLSLGQRFILDLGLTRAAIQVAGIGVTAESNPITSVSRTGAQTFISDTSLRRLPTLYRSFNEFISAAPQVVGRSFTGQNDRFNNVQVDGTVNNDLFSLGSSNGTPGGGVNARPISIEALREYQILIAPFDVRQGGFVGGLVNAVTKSGTNEYHGAVFGYMQNQNLVGKDTAGVKVPVDDFQQQQFGFAFGGPIIRDKLHFFVTGDFRHDNRPFSSSLQIAPDTTGVGITQERADSVQNILQTTYSFDPGTWRAPQINNPETNLFGKLDYELGTNSHIEISGVYVNANQDKLVRNYRSGWTPTPSFSNARDGYQLSGAGYSVENKTRTIRGKWTASFANRYSNEFIVGRTTISDLRPPANGQPLILVAGNSPGTYLSAGAERFSQANSLDQRVIELSDNVTFSVARHILTVGTHNEFIHFRNVFFPGSIGMWTFASPDSLAQGLPAWFGRAVPGPMRPDGPVADFNVNQIGFYAQDRFSPITNLNVTVGLRMDIPSLPSPAENPALDTIAFPSLGGGTVRTSSSPSGNILWSPRVGFNYDVRGDRQTILRGGAGVFSGRPPYVWVSNAFGNTGMEQLTLVCSGAVQVPTFTVDPLSQPAQCADGTLPSGGATSIVFYDQNFKFPQALKIALGLDHQLPWNIFATFDFIYTKAINQFYLQDVNLQGVQGTAAGEAGRTMYGTINAATGRSTVLRRTSNANDIILNRNISKDRSTSFTVQLQKRFSDGLEFNAAYTYAHTQDVFSLTSDITSSNYNFSALDGTLENRNLRTSVFDRPHKLTLSGTVNGPFATRFSLLYNGVSGSPFSYTVNGDANGDGVSGNDMVYVPRDASDITLQNPSDYATLDAYISGESCLRQNRGRLLPRNSCRNRWQNYLNARISKVIRTVGGQSVEITADMLNVLNFVNSSWGLQRLTSVFETTSLLRQVAYDTVNQRGTYALNLPRKDVVQVNSIGSRWVFQLGARYAF